MEKQYLERYMEKIKVRFSRFFKEEEKQMSIDLDQNLSIEFFTKYIETCEKMASEFGKNRKNI